MFAFVLNYFSEFLYFVGTLREDLDCSVAWFARGGVLALTFFGFFLLEFEGEGFRCEALGVADVSEVGEVFGWLGYCEEGSLRLH